MYADKLKQIEQSILDGAKGDKDKAKDQFEKIRKVVFLNSHQQKSLQT